MWEQCAVASVLRGQRVRALRVGSQPKKDATTQGESGDVSVEMQMLVRTPNS